MKTENQEVQVFEGPDRIQMVCLLVRRSACQIEAKTGMTHSGGSVLAKMKKFYKLKRTAKPDEIIARLNQEIEALDKKICGSL